MTTECQNRHCRKTPPIARHGARGGTKTGGRRKFCSDRCATMDSQRRMYLRRRKAGMCPNCGRARDRGRLLLCEACAWARKAPTTSRWNGDPMTREQALRVLGRTA